MLSVDQEQPAGVSYERQLAPGRPAPVLHQRPHLQHVAERCRPLDRRPHFVHDPACILRPQLDLAQVLSRSAVVGNQLLARQHHSRVALRRVVGRFPAVLFARRRVGALRIFSAAFSTSSAARRPVSNSHLPGLTLCCLSFISCFGVPMGRAVPPGANVPVRGRRSLTAGSLFGGATARDPRQVLHARPGQLRARVAARGAGDGAGQPQDRPLRAGPAGRQRPGNGRPALRGSCREGDRNRQRSLRAPGQDAEAVAGVAVRSRLRPHR